MHKLGDLVIHGSAEELRKALLALEGSLNEISNKLRARRDIGNANGVYAGVGRSTADQLALMRENVDGPIEITACVVRTVFEINLALRFCCLSLDNMNAFIAQSVTDEISIYKAIKRLAHEGTPSESLTVIDTHIESLRSKLHRHNLPLKPHRVTTSKMAEAVGLSSEYDTMYAIYSKYVHASAWLVLREKRTTDAPTFRLPMQANAQLYAVDTLERLRAVN